MSQKNTSCDLVFIFPRKKKKEKERGGPIILFCLTHTKKMSYLLRSRLAAATGRNTLRLSPAIRQFASKTVVVERELPKPPPPSRKRWLLGGAAVGAVVWIVGLGGALNHQRLSSSVVHGTLFTVRYDSRVISLIGDRIDYADSWPWISGTVNHLKGKIDIGFDVKGSTGK
jgi:cytochrome c oxidase assembly factor 1